MSNNGFNPFGVFGKPSGPMATDTVTTQIGRIHEAQVANAAAEANTVTTAGLNEGRAKGRASTILGGGQGSLLGSTNTYSAGRTLLGL